MREGGGAAGERQGGWCVPSPGHEKLPVCKCSARYFVWPPRVRTSCVRCSLESLVLAGARPISYLRFLCTLTFLPPVARRLCSEWRVMPILG